MTSTFIVALGIYSPLVGRPRRSRGDRERVLCANYSLSLLPVPRFSSVAAPSRRSRSLDSNYPISRTKTGRRPSLGWSRYPARSLCRKRLLARSSTTWIIAYGCSSKPWLLVFSLFAATTCCLVCWSLLVFVRV